MAENRTQMPGTWLAPQQKSGQMLPSQILVGLVHNQDVGLE